MDYLSTNRQSWNAWADVNFGSKFYDVPAFLAGRNSLNAIELELLGDVRGNISRIAGRVRGGNTDQGLQ